MRFAKDICKAISWLRRPEAIRQRCDQVLAAGEADRLDHFRVDLTRLPATARYVVETTHLNYPDLQVPYHSRWRHFSVGGRDRWTELAAGLADEDPLERARRRIDLAVTSVLLDAGAGKDWCYAEPGGGVYERSEGLAVASLHLFASGILSSIKGDPLRADGAALADFNLGDLARAFQVSDRNPLAGLEGRAALLRSLAAAMRTEPSIFGETQPRPGKLLDCALNYAEDGRLEAKILFGLVVRGLARIWPGRLTLGGVNLGDVWRHSMVAAEGPSSGLVPFHKLSQWLTYSLVEPLEEAGVTVVGLDQLTGLAEYRNGGLFVDFAVLVPRSPDLFDRPQQATSEPIVEWRALTVALLDKVAELVRAELGLNAEDFPLAKVLEGGTWSAGRRIAAERRADGSPPITILSDGTLF